MKESNGGVTLLVLNMDKTAETTLNLPVWGERYTLSSPDLLSKTVLLNGTELKASSDGSAPNTSGQPFKPGTVRFAPLTITFLTVPSAANRSCTR
jgi:hypothetical protein